MGICVKLLSIDGSAGKSASDAPQQLASTSVCMAMDQADGSYGPPAGVGVGVEWGGLGWGVGPSEGLNPNGAPNL